jgi:hypothetical protein
VRHEQVELRILGQGADFSDIKIEFVDGKRALRDGEPRLVAPDGGGLENEFICGSGRPARRVVDGVSLV